MIRGVAESVGISGAVTTCDGVGSAFFVRDLRLGLISAIMVCFGVYVASVIQFKTKYEAICEWRLHSKNCPKLIRLRV